MSPVRARHSTALLALPPPLPSHHTQTHTESSSYSLPHWTNGQIGEGFS